VIVRAFAPAKINLYLHVLGRRPDGYHLLNSLIAFADIGDWITAAPAPALSLTIGGPEAQALTTAGDDNLVLRAARLLAKTVPGTPPGATLHLEKYLPVSSGVGGGSSDAAASLRALCKLWRHQPEPAALAALALELGADTPACLVGEPVWVGGIGEELEYTSPLPEVGVLLVNPRHAVATPAVFKTRQGPFSFSGRFDSMPTDAARLAATLAGRRNDLTDATVALVPEVARVLDRLARLPGALIARMSGSGATCFALFADTATALSAEAELARSEPRWWCAAGRLMNRPPVVEVYAEREPPSRRRFSAS
jgi:4-diphosphocytidyl-2-C-methyl-D-erythritol kinase